MGEVRVMSLLTNGSEKSIVSEENVNHKDGDVVNPEFLVDSFNKYYTDYLTRFGHVGETSEEGDTFEQSENTDHPDIDVENMGNDSFEFNISEELSDGLVAFDDEDEEYQPVVLPSFDPFAEVPEAEFVAESVPVDVEEDEDLSLVTDVEPLVEVPESDVESDPVEAEVSAEDVPVSVDDSSDEQVGGDVSEVTETEVEAPVSSVEEDGVSVEGEVEPVAEATEIEPEAGVSDDLVSDEPEAVSLDDVEDSEANVRPVVFFDDEDDEDSVGFYDPEAIIIDREHARNVAEREGRSVSDDSLVFSPAPPVHNITPVAEAKPEPQVVIPDPAPAPAAPAPRPVAPVQDRPLVRSYDDQPEVQIRPRTAPKKQKKGGLFAGLFKKAEKEADVSSPEDFQEFSRLRESGAPVGDAASTEQYIGNDENKVISVTTQDDYDPREERRRLQHVGAEHRAHVDPSVWLEQTMIDALKLGASDLHITVEGETDNLRARIRVDGQMRDFDYVTGTPARVIMGRLKAATKLSSGGSYAPEETIYEIELDGEKRKARAVLFRVEDGGEALVMRLPLTGALRQLDELDFSEQNLQLVRELLAMPYKLIMLAGPMGSGKGSPAWERILTPSGWTTYGEIKVGDTVIGSDGKATEVTGVFPRGELDVYKVAFNDGSSVTVDGDHLWSVQSADSRHKGRGFKTIATSELAASPLRNSKSNDAHRWFIPVVKPVQFSKQESPLPVHPYVLGALLGDGGFDGRGVNFSSVDADFAEHVNERLPEGVSLRLLDKAPSRAGKCPHYNVVGNGKDNALLQEFRSMGLLGKKSADKFVPEQYLYASVEERLELLRGLMDSDGHADTVSGAEFSSVSKALADAVVFITRSLGGVAKISERYTGYKNNQGVRVEGQLSYRVTVKLPAEFNPFRLSRKADAWVAPSKYPVARAISSIEPVGRDEVICIQVAADDSLYVADHFIVTHNTTTAHGALMHIADPTRTVWTIEDPVERRLPNLVQLEIDEGNGAGFDVLLSKLLRADYNTLFLGEIRDNATAAAAVRQAKAGRQVMSTIHADDNIKSLMRLIELAGDSPMSVLSAVGGVISQRLVRKLNPEWDGEDPSTKYKGRVPIHEILFVNDAIVEVMMDNRPLSEIKQQVKDAKGSSFYDDAMRLINAGVTDREEVVRVIGEFDAEDRY